MLEFLSTTAVIFCWGFVLSLLWAGFVYKFFRFRPAKVESSTLSMLPALILSPVFILSGFSLLKWNLIFPVRAVTSDWFMMLYCFTPALVLFLASGIAFQVSSTVRGEYHFFRRQLFSTVAVAMGIPVDRSLRRLVLAKSLLESWACCLPWFFGELVVVEAMFNAPGLGYRSWNQARIRDISGLMETASWLVGFYLVVLLATSQLNSWLGRRLESYS